MSLTRVMAVEVAELGIRVNAVAPGMARTSLVDAGIENGSIDLEGDAIRDPHASPRHDGRDRQGSLLLGVR